MMFRTVSPLFLGFSHRRRGGDAFGRFDNHRLNMAAAAPREEFETPYILLFYEKNTLSVTLLLILSTTFR